jgi:hypothetical protein
VVHATGFIKPKDIGVFHFPSNIYCKRGDEIDPFPGKKKANNPLHCAFRQESHYIGYAKADAPTISQVFYFMMFRGNRKEVNLQPV